MYELAKTYIEKDECLDKHEMEEILKNKKNSSKKKNLTFITKLYKFKYIYFIFYSINC
jgi:hypothetical protein